MVVIMVLLSEVILVVEVIKAEVIVIKAEVLLCVIAVAGQ